MYKVRLFLILIFILFMSREMSIGALISVNNGESIYYSESKRIWAPDGYSRDFKIYTKKNSLSDGEYSIYFNKSGNVAFFLGSDFEFIKKGHLIACHNSDLTFYEVVCENDEFTEKKLDFSAVQEIFKGVEIIRISDFDNNKIVINKRTEAPKEFLLFNDTTNSFIRHKYKPKSVQKSKIKALFTVKNQGIIEFSGLDGVDEKYIIEVK